MKPMKNNVSNCAWSVCSETDAAGRRLITLGRVPRLASRGRRSIAKASPARPGGVRLRAVFAPEAGSAFWPLISAPAPVRRQPICRSNVEYLNA